MCYEEKMWLTAQQDKELRLCYAVQEEEEDAAVSAPAPALPFLRRSPKEGLATQAERSVAEASAPQLGRRGRRSVAPPAQ